MNSTAAAALKAIDTATATLTQQTLILCHRLSDYGDAAEVAGDIDPDFLNDTDRRLRQVAHLLSTIAAMSQAACGDSFIPGVELTDAQRAESVGNLQRFLGEYANDIR